METTIKEMADRIGFDMVRIASAKPLEEDRRKLEQWRKGGNAADLHYMVRDYPRRWMPEDLLPGAKSVITFATNYYSRQESISPLGGRIGMYAWGKDYHKVLGKALREFSQRLYDISGGSAKTKFFVDSGPLLERAFAREGGMGFIGKNTAMITKNLGSFVFLSEVLTTLALRPDPLEESKKGDPCGSCRICLEKCPTQALTSPRNLDSRKCISYLTIENRGEIPQDLRSLMGNWIFGCDVCQEVCPYNKRLKETNRNEFRAGSGKGRWISLMEILEIKSDEDFKKLFSGTPILRAKRSGILRNACVAVGNSGLKEALPYIRKLSQEDKDPIVRNHARWALEQFEQKVRA